MFRVQAGSGEPVYQQLMQEVKRAIAYGRLKPGDQLPSVRDLAETLGLNPNTVARAYRLLEEAGVIETAVGRGSFVSQFHSRVLPKERRKRITDLIDRLLAEGHALRFSPEEVLAMVEKEVEERTATRKP